MTEDTGSTIDELKVSLESPLEQVSSGFDPSIIPSLPAMSLEQLLQLEDVLSQEFASLSRQYVESRKSRIEQLLSIINKQLHISQGHEQQWADKYAYEIELIEQLIHSTEDEAFPQMKTKGPKKGTASGIESIEQDLMDLLSNINLPLHMDSVFSEREKELPFAHQFGDLIRPYKEQLNALWLQKDYDINMIETLTEKNRTILWKQYRQDILDYKQKLIDQTYHELTELYEEYHGIRENAMAEEDEAHYFKSVISTDDIKLGAEREQIRLAKGNIDSFYDVDNVYYKNNKIETTAYKMAALESIRKFESAQNAYRIPQRDDATVKLSSCSGLTSEEIDQDLETFKSLKHRKEVPPETVVVDALSEKQADYKELLSLGHTSSKISMTPLELRGQIEHE